MASRRIGWIAEPDGLNPIAALSGHLPNTGPAPRNVQEWLERAKVDVLFEASSLDAQAGQPAIEHIVAALEAGAHVVTANKGPIVFAYRELVALAKEKDRKFLFESTVMDGVPIFSLFPLGLPLTELRDFPGVLNSTTNVVLTEVKRGARSTRQFCARRHWGLRRPIRRRTWTDGIPRSKWQRWRRY